VADPLQSESAVRVVVTLQPECRSAGKRGNGKGGITSGGESQSIPQRERTTEGTRAESRAEKRKREDTLERKGCVVGENLKEVGTREEEGRLRRRGKWTRGRVRLCQGGAQLGTQVNGSRGLRYDYLSELH